MNIFDIVGPIMVGPSSSHTAGAVRIGYITRRLLGEPVIRAEIGLCGSFLATGKGHGTDKALVAGLLGLAVDDMRIPESFEMAKKRRGKLCSVDKANVLECSRLWRETVERLSHEYPEVEVSYMYVDNAAMQLILNPAQFDVMITGNLFGDILSDESAAIAGSLGMMPSASLGSTTRGLYEPIHGSAPDIAGRDIANPLGTILSGALLLRHSLGLEQEAAAIERAVSQVLDEGYRTGDIFSAGCTKVGCTQMGDLVAERV